VLATRLGAAAIEALAAGKHGVLVGIVKSDVVATPLAAGAQQAGKARLEVSHVGIANLAFLRFVAPTDPVRTLEVRHPISSASREGR